MKRKITGFFCISLLILCLPVTAFKIDIKSIIGLTGSTGRLSSSSSDYSGSSLLLKANAIRNIVQKRTKNFIDFFPTSVSSQPRDNRLFEPISVDYVTGLESKDYYPFFAVSYSYSELFVS